MTKAKAVEKTAVDEMVDFGYKDEGDGTYVKYKGGTPREKWEAVDGGFLRFARRDGNWVPVPATIAPEFEGVSGLTYESHPQCFSMLYTEEYVRTQYAGGNASRAERLEAYEASKAAGLH